LAWKESSEHQKQSMLNWEFILNKLSSPTYASDKSHIVVDLEVETPAFEHFPIEGNEDRLSYAVL
jgi:hypothetical protein